VRTNSIHRCLQIRKRRLGGRLSKFNSPQHDGPVLAAQNIRYELAQRDLGTPYGGIGGATGRQ